jgi:hypothetical protein
MPLVQTQAPSIEPITLAQAKSHMRVDADLTSDDALITLLITAARVYAETYTQRSFITQKWRLVMDCFPGGSLVPGTYFGAGVPYSNPRNALLFPQGPVQSVDSIVYLDMSGTQQTVSAPGLPDYAIDLSGPVPRMAPGFGKIWPIPLPQIGSVQVNFTAGYGDTADKVPAGICQWLLLRVGTLYENREEVALMNRGKVEPLPYVDTLLDPYTVRWA